MQDLIDVAVENLLKMIRPNIKPDEALKYTQAAANLSHVMAQYQGQPKKGPAR